jgi:hypothetical protein
VCAGDSGGVQMLAKYLTRLFEPCLIQLLPQLLLSQGDHDTHVRRAAEDCSHEVMASLSAHGVKLILPALLHGLDEESWRTKCGSVEMLGAMAYCAPEQLGSCLPNVVPKLIDTMADTHKRVQEASRTALTQIARVIKCPEVRVLTPQLLAALEDPTNTGKFIEQLRDTRFVHMLDAPSLALVMPVIRRAFDDRSTETRRCACAIIASVYQLTEQKDIVPYVDALLPGVQKSLMDPVPAIRAVAAKALGAMIGSATGDLFERLNAQLVPWLKRQLISTGSSVDRSGAAQGLAEVLYAMDAIGQVDQLTLTMPNIINTTMSDSVDACVRDGYLMMYIYLPLVFTDRFRPYLPRILPAILKVCDA